MLRRISGKELPSLKSGPNGHKTSTYNQVIGNRSSSVAMATLEPQYDNMANYGQIRARGASPGGGRINLKALIDQNKAVNMNDL